MATGDSAVRTARGVEISGPPVARAEEVLTREAVDFVAGLERTFRSAREWLLVRREERQRELLAGALPDFPSETQSVRAAEWRVAPVPPGLADRRVEITGPVDRKMMINALNSGASTFMADFEDANTPSWANVVAGQANLVDAVEGTLSFTVPDGQQYRLGERTATLLVRPRGWHLVERHMLVDGRPVSASLFDFGLYFFHNARRRAEMGGGIWLYLPKLESHREARVWRDVFCHAEDAVGLPRGTVRATVLVENVLAAFEMDEILYELREHSGGLNAGRWDYIFSFIRKFRERPDFVFPDRAQVTMAVPFMRAYAQLLVRTCHRRGAYAIGGMAAFIPNRRDPVVTEQALARVREDKERELGDGFDGTWVAHPDLVAPVREVFVRGLGGRTHQLDRLREDVAVSAQDLLDVRVPGGRVTDAGVRSNVSVGIRYLESWLRGVGAASIDNLMEDAATCEISRSQLWQWLRHRARLDDGRAVTAPLVRRAADEVLDGFRQSMGPEAFAAGRFAEARSVFEEVVLRPEYTEFLTLPAYERID